MLYAEVFVWISFIWGIFSLISLSFCQLRKRKYSWLVVALLIVAWGYLFACVPLFKLGAILPDNMALYFTILAMVLSLEVWVVMLLTLLGIAIAKTNHDENHHSYLLRFHQPLVNICKPLWLILCLINVINAGYYFIVN